jgi:hypothetical protein
MKIKLTLKDPDGVYASIGVAIYESIGEVDGLSDRERRLIVRERRNEIDEQLSRWLRFGECLTVEIDIETQTARVVPANE